MESRLIIANGNVVKDDDVIFFLATVRGTQVCTQVYLYEKLLLVKITSGRSPGSVNFPFIIAVDIYTLACSLAS